MELHNTNQINITLPPKLVFVTDLDRTLVGKNDNDHNSTNFCSTILVKDLASMKPKFIPEIKRSLSAYFSKFTKIILGNMLLAILVILIWTIPQPNAETDILITTFTGIDKTIQLSKLTVLSTISDYYKAKAYMNTIAVAISSFIWPLSMVLILMFIWAKSLYPSTRTKLLLFVVLTSKISLLTCFTEAILTYSTFLDVKHENIIEVKTT
eukprot:901761_1